MINRIKLKKKTTENVCYSCLSHLLSSEKDLIKILIGWFFPLQAGFYEEATFTVSRNNKFTLTHGGYGYTKHRVLSSGVIYYYCRKQKEFKCSVKAYTMQIGTRNMVKVKGEHLHPPEC